MSHSYDPRKLLKHISNQLLRALFARYQVFQDLPWEEFAEKQMEPVFAAWQHLPDAKRKQIQVVLQDVHDLVDGRGLKIFAEELCRDYPEHIGTFSALEGHFDKALWAYLHLPSAFDQAAQFARADALQGGRYWVKRNSLPRRPVVVDPDIVSELQQELHDHYWPSEMRGKHCKVEHYDRNNGSQYFYAYLDDWPDKRLVFDDDGEMLPQRQRIAFSNVFVFNPDEGTLELVAKGGAVVHSSLQKAFCRSVLGIDVGPAEPLRPAYRLDRLLDPSFTFVTDPADRIARVPLESVRLGPAMVADQAVNYLGMGFSEETDLAGATATIRHCVGQACGDVSIRHASFQITFLPDADHCVKQMTFYVTVPSTCNLRSKPDEQRLVGERCLKLWGMTNA